ncbi:glycosyltransferase family 61 protein [Methylobacterium sp. ID0610]|uniref:glycosyltransferase family 61 protein n=1 Tax=Methylobacterium carpenticola TaxID=3344827 RepID=UPI0036B84FD4
MHRTISDIVWVYTHSHDPDGKVIQLAADGLIVGDRHPNEHSWTHEDGRLLFRDVEGRVSVVFELPDLDDLPQGLQGRFVLWPDSGITTWLSRSAGTQRLTGRSAYALAGTVDRIAEAADIAYPEARYGHRDPGLRGYRAHPIDCLTLADATVLTPYGLIERDGSLATESLFHFPFFSEKRLTRLSEEHFVRAAIAPALRFKRALHAMAGVSGNHYHWMLFFLGRIVLFAEARPDDRRCVVLLPDYLNAVQRRSAEMVADHYGLTVARLQDGAAVQVDELVFPHQRGSMGVDPHPAVMKTFVLIRNATARTVGEGAKRLYISRADSALRRLENEAEVEDLLSGHGFRVIRLAGATLEEQVAALADARVVIGPHGAGMTNVAFCRPGAKVLEFQSPSYVSWCMRNLAVLAELDYGHLMGEATDGDRYRIDLDQLRSTLSAMGL